MRISISRGVWFFLVGFGIFMLLSVRAGRMDRAFLQAAVPSFGAVLGAALLHELGHFAAARLMGASLGGIKLELFGARMALPGVLSYRQEAWIAAAGPTVNLLTAVPVCRIRPQEGAAALADWLVSAEPSAVFALASLGLAAINCLPIRTLDGGRVLDCVLSSAFGPPVADAVLRVTTGLCLGAMWLFSVYALLRVGEMLSLFVFSLLLLGRVLGPDPD